MRNLFTWLVAGLMVISFPRAMQAAGSEEVVLAAVREADGRKPDEALQILLRAERGAPRSAELLAQISMAWSHCVDVASDKSAGERAAKNAMETAERAIKADPNNANAHVSLAIAYGEMTSFVGNSMKMALSKRIRDEAIRATELDSKNSAAHYVLGRWNYGMANLNPILRLAARIAFGAMPPASMEEAVRNLEKAVVLAPEKIDHRQALATAYQTTREHEKAVQQWKAILELPAKDAADEQAKKEARAALGH